MRATQGEIWRFCHGVLGPDGADDATQEIFIAAWRSVGTYRGDASARTWLFVIARRTLQREVRRLNLRRESEPLSPTLAMASRASAVEVREEVARLEPDRRVAFVLTQFIGMSYAEVAAICECPVGTIRSRVARARHDLVRMRDESSSSKDVRRGDAQAGA